MTTILGNLILFFLTTLPGFVILMGTLAYLEYVLARDIYQHDTALHSLVKNSIKYVRTSKKRIIPIYTPTPNLKPARVRIQRHSPKKSQKILISDANPRMTH